MNQLNSPLTEAVSQRCSIKKGLLRTFAKFTGKHLCQSLFFNKVAGLNNKDMSLLFWPVTLLIKRLWYWCFPVNLAKFSRTPFYRTPPVAASALIELSSKSFKLHNSLRKLMANRTYIAGTFISVQNSQLNRLMYISKLQFISVRQSSNLTPAIAAISADVLLNNDFATGKVTEIK